jgi:hypothetical protein
MQPKRSFPRTLNCFVRVYAFITHRTKWHEPVCFNDHCLQIFNDRQKKGHPLLGRRAFMHSGHTRNQRGGPRVCTICCWGPATEELSGSFLVGLFLHEFGHLITRGNEKKADRWVFEKLGVPLRYKGDLKLEWVSPSMCKKLGI